VIYTVIPVIPVNPGISVIPAELLKVGVKDAGCAIAAIQWREFYVPFVPDNNYNVCIITIII
jgi:hypothetical protein